LPQAILHDAVLTRVVREDRDAAAGSEHVDGLVDAAGQDVELAVDLDANGLEGALRRMAAATTGRRRDGVAHDGRELDGRGHGAGGHDGPGDAPGEPLVTEVAHDAGQLGLVIGVDHVGGGAPGRAVHPHVEGSVLAVTEATVGPIELRRADTEVEQHADHRVDAGLLGRDLGEPIEPGPHRDDAPRELVEQPSRGRESILVLIDADDPQVRVVGEQGAGVPAAAERGIDHDAGRHGGEQGGDLGDHDGLMVKGGLTRHVGAFAIGAGGARRPITGRARGRCGVGSG
jgi:hypothetical protein